MGGGIEPNSPACFTECGGNQGRYAPFTIGSTDVNRWDDFVRIAERLQEGASIGEPELDGCRAGEKKVECLGVGQRHRSLVGGTSHRNDGAPPRFRSWVGRGNGDSLELSSIRRARRGVAVPACAG